MPTPVDASRPVKSNALTSFQDGYQFHTAADWNDEANQIFTQHNAAAAVLYTHAARHATTGADPITASVVGAPGLLRYWFSYFAGA